MKFYRLYRKKSQALKYYYKEIEKYKHFYNINLTQKEALRIINWLSKEINVTVKEVTFDLNSTLYGGRANRDGHLLFNKVRISLLAVCHELVHLLCYKKKIPYYHSYKFAKELDKVIKFVEKNLILEFLLVENSGGING